MRRQIWCTLHLRTHLTKDHTNSETDNLIRISFSKLSLFISSNIKCSSAKQATVSIFNQVISLHPKNSFEHWTGHTEMHFPYGIHVSPYALLREIQKMPLVVLCCCYVLINNKVYKTLSISLTWKPSDCVKRKDKRNRKLKKTFFCCKSLTISLPNNCISDIHDDYTAKKIGRFCLK